MKNFSVVEYKKGGRKLYISHVNIKKYRNIRNVNVDLQCEAVIVGENNGGKSNFLRAITLPLVSDEIAYTSKRLY